jgi:hypothetical protein
MRLEYNNGYDRLFDAPESFHSDPDEDIGDVLEVVKAGNYIGIADGVVFVWESKAAFADDADPIDSFYVIDTDRLGDELKALGIEREYL